MRNRVDNVAKLTAKRQACLFVLPVAFLLCLTLANLGKFQFKDPESRQKAFVQSYTHLRLRRALVDDVNVTNVNQTDSPFSSSPDPNSNSTESFVTTSTTFTPTSSPGSDVNNSTGFVVTRTTTQAPNTSFTPTTSSLTPDVKNSTDFFVTRTTTLAPPRTSTIFTPTVTTLGTTNVTKEDCLVPSVNDFPRDLFSDETLANGAIAIHILVSTYLFYSLAVVCDIYFVPSLEVISEGLRLPSNIAGATFMAAGTSCPELFTSLIGVFITEGDIGVGTIVGSAVFNNVAVVSFSGLLAGMVVPIDWWPLTRDCGYYILTVIALILVLIDGFVYWYEAMVLVIMFGLYIVLMYYNNEAETLTKAIVNACRSSCCVNHEEKEPLLKNGDAGEHSNHVNGNGHIANGGEDDLKSKHQNHNTDLSDQPMCLEQSDDMFSPLTLPEGCLKKLVWFIEWPCNLIFYFTIPDCRKPKWRSWFGVTFFISIVYIGILTYITTWMVTVIGYTFGIPDTVMGLTFLAAGTSVPEAFSSVIVCRQGYGNMAISNSVGSNIFDILFCLGIPWLIKAAAFSVGESRVEINSSGLFDTAIALLTTVLFLWIALAVNKFRLDKKIGFSCLVVYIMFLIFSSVVELTGIGGNRTPTCLRD